MHLPAAVAVAPRRHDDRTAHDPRPLPPRPAHRLYKPIRPFRLPVGQQQLRVRGDGVDHLAAQDAVLAVLRLQVAVVAEGSHRHVLRQRLAEMGLVTAEAGIQHRDLDALAAPAGRVPGGNAHVLQQNGRVRRRTVSTRRAAKAGISRKGRKNRPARSASKGLDGGRSIMVRRSVEVNDSVYPRTEHGVVLPAPLRTKNRTGVGKPCGMRTSGALHHPAEHAEYFSYIVDVIFSNIHCDHRSDELKGFPRSTRGGDAIDGSLRPPSRSFTKWAANMAAMHWPSPLNTLSFLASTIATSGLSTTS